MEEGYLAQLPLRLYWAFVHAKGWEGGITSNLISYCQCVRFLDYSLNELCSFATSLLNSGNSTKILWNLFLNSVVLTTLLYKCTLRSATVQVRVEQR